MKLYSYWRSTTSYRVRAALNLKGLAHDVVPVDLLAGHQRATEFATRNPGKGVPVLELDDGMVLTQSLAIIDYLDAVAAPRLLPDDPLDRARVMAAAHAVALDIHPVNNLRVVQKLKSDHGADGKAWMRHWMAEGFAAVEAMLDPDAVFSFSDRPDLADICITSQVYNARRWEVALETYPNIARVEAACLALPAFQAAHPDNQMDAI